MAISIDDVYQKVLAIANKEQRGYVTPQEFNLFANKAQKEIFDSYFHDLKTSYHKPTKTDMTHGDDMDILSEKLHPFKTTGIDTPVATDGIYTSLITLPTNLYMINTVTKTEGEVSEISEKEVLYTENNPLTKATKKRSVYVRRETNQIQVYPVPLVNTTYTIDYYKKPESPKWNYVVVMGKALYNANLSTNFDLHDSEEETLVTRILQLAGVAIEKMELYQVAAADGASIKQSQND
tara:strand:- start:22928 stop:23638 length:711 start_codon:yes stop_codon:yes gene_type:complete